MTNLNDVKELIASADSILITAGNGFAKNEGLDILSENFDQDFSEIAKKYDVHTIGDALDKKFSSWDEEWQFWSKLIAKYTLNYKASPAMKNLKEILQDKEYFIATSTFAHYFENAGFNQNRIFDAFGDWTKIQCSSGINHGIKSNLDVVTAYLQDKGQVPKCEICNSEMELHMPLNSHFYPDTDANSRLRWFLTAMEDKKMVVLELGVDETSPQLLDPMINLVQQFDSWHYLAVDLAPEDFPDDLKRVTAFDQSIDTFLTELEK